MTRIELPGGQWAEVIDASEVTERKRSRIRTSGAAYAEASGAEAQGDAVFAFRARTALAFLSAWSFPAPPSEDAIADLPWQTAEALLDATDALRPALFPDMGYSPEAASDPKATTAE